MGEVALGNNAAEERITDRDSHRASPYSKFDEVLGVHNPTRHRLRVRMEISRLPHGWSAAVDQRFLWIEPGATQWVRYHITPGNGLDDVPGRRVDVNVEAWAAVDATEIQIGGVTTSIHLAGP